MRIDDSSLQYEDCKQVVYIILKSNLEINILSKVQL